MRGLLGTVVAGATALGVLVAPAHAAVDFAPPVKYPAPAPTAITQGDFNGDGLIDLAAIGAGETNATILLGTGDGSFRAAPPFTIDPALDIAAGALDDDGFDDLALASAGGQLDRWVSNGDGTFGGNGDWPAGAGSSGVALGRLDAGSTIDAVVANPDASTVSFHAGIAGGGFQPAFPIGFPDAPSRVAIGDLDADGDNDLAVAAGGDVYAAENNDGFFTPSPGLVGTGARGITVVDVDRNGRGDIVAAKDDGNLAVVRSSASGPTGFDFEAAFDQDAGGTAKSVAAADLDSDGLPDLIVPNEEAKMTALIGQGDGRFDAAPGFATPGTPFDAVIGDFNRDGNPDTAVVSAVEPSASGVHVFIARRPQLSLTPPNIDFGPVRPGTTSETRTFRLTNNGPQRAQVAGVALQGASEFAVVSNNCDGASLGIGQSCEVGVRFAPAAAGRREGRLAIATHNAGGPHLVGLAGAGAAAPTGPVAGGCANDLNGTSAANTLTGTDAGDNIFGFGGSDVLNGLGGDDCLLGGDGNDRLNGGDGLDTLEGGRGNDVGDGGNGNDRLIGASGRDKLTGGSGKDSLNGGSSADRLSGGSGNDRLTGGPGKNSYSGGPGRDNITAANGRVEKIDCGAGRDKVRADKKDRLKRCERVRRTRR